MKTIVFLIVLSGIFTLKLGAQGEIKTRQLTSDPAQQGFPSWSPDGKHILYQYTDRYDSLGKNGLWVLTSEGGEARQVFRGIAEHPQWSPDDQFIVFDADTGKSIKMIPAGGGSPANFLPDSVHIVNGGMPRWSPDASYIAFLEGATMSLCVYNMITGRLSRIFHQDGILPFPGCWYSDGRYILVALMDMETRKSTLWKISLDGEKREQILGHHENMYRHLALSPDDALLIYAALVEGYLGLYIMPSGGGASLPLLVTPGFHNEGVSWAPDGRRIAYSSGRSGNSDIWIMDIDTEGIRKKLQAAGR